LISENTNKTKEIVKLIWKLVTLNIKIIKNKNVKRQFIYFVCYTMSFLKESPKSKLFQIFYLNFDECLNFCERA
jgi:hypothetical protein